MALRSVLAVLMVALAEACAHAQVNEYQVKAAFLYNFARYVEWPPAAFAGPGDPIAICVLGQNPFGGALEQATAGKAIEGRPFVVRTLADLSRSCGCHILFVSAAEHKHFRAQVANIRGSGILMVGESQGFTAEGGVINFKLEGGKVRFEINVESAAQERLRISSKLLSLAQIVQK